MQLKDSNLWLVGSLLLTNIVAPVLVWNLQQGQIERLKMSFEAEKLQMEKDRQSAEMFEKLAKTLAEQRQIYDAYTTLVQAGQTASSFELQETRRRLEEKDQEVTNVKEILSRLTGKKIEYIKGSLPPLPPSRLSVQ